MFFCPSTRGGFRGTVPTPLVPTAIHTLKVHFASRLCRQRTTGETSNRWQVTTWRRSRAAAESLEWPVFNDAFFFMALLTVPNPLTTLLSVVPDWVSVPSKEQNPHFVLLTISLFRLSDTGGLDQNCPRQEVRSEQEHHRDQCHHENRAWGATVAETSLTMQLVS